ncbi:MAG: ABC transporter permease [Chloroflexota bacterium]
MTFRQNIQVAFSALMANKLRSALTMLGIIIGVAAVVSLVSIGEGVESAITGEIEGAGSNIVAVVPGAEFGPSAGEDTFTLADAEAIENEVANLDGVAPQYVSTGQLQYEDTTVVVSITGTTANVTDVLTINMELGNFFTITDNDNAERVIVIDEDTAEDLYGQLNPVGRFVRVNGVRFEIIGMVESEGGGLTGGGGATAYVPINTAYRTLFGATTERGTDNPVTVITMSATTADDIDQVADDVLFLMRDRYDVGINEEDTFTVISQDDLLEIVGQVTGILTLFLGAVAGISLVVGGIGIMNISLVSVTERTREIGLRKAVGAKYRHIVTQFLIETIVLSTLGGLIGIALSFLAAWGITQTDLLVAVITPESVLLGVGFSMLVGVFFGAYPANRAAQLHPIEALRYE